MLALLPPPGTRPPSEFFLWSWGRGGQSFFLPHLVLDGFLLKIICLSRCHSGTSWGARPWPLQFHEFGPGPLMLFTKVRCTLHAVFKTKYGHQGQCFKLFGHSFSVSSISFVLGLVQEVGRGGAWETAWWAVEGRKAASMEVRDDSARTSQQLEWLQRGPYS